MKTARESDETFVGSHRRRGGVASFADDGKIVFNSVAITKRIYGFNELFLLGRRGGVGKRVRARAKAAHPRGARTRAGREPRRNAGRLHRKPSRHHHADDRPTSRRRASSLDARALVPSARFEQAYTPRFSRGRQVGDLQLVDRGRLPRHPAGRSRHRTVLRDHARPRHGLGADASRPTAI